MFNKLSKGMIFALLGTFFSACSIVLIRYLLLEGENPLNLTAWIALFTLIPWIFVFNRHKKEFVALSTKNILLLVFIGIAVSIGFNYLQTLALAYSPAINFSFIYRTVVVFTIIFAWLFFKERITRQKIVLVAFILLGSYLLTTNGQDIVLSKGDIYSLMVAASAAFVLNILMKHTVSKMHVDLSGSVVAIVICVSLVSLSFITNVFSVPQNLFLIFIGGVFSFLLIMMRNRAYKFATASFVSMVFALTPLFVALLSFPILHETLTFIEVLGGLIIIGATFFVEKFKI